MSERFEWAIVEQMGHKRLVGRVLEVQVAGVPMLRIDVPDGDKPIEDPKATQFIHASTLYALTPTTEAVVRKLSSAMNVSPAALYGALPSGRGGDYDDDPIDIEDEDESGDPPDPVEEMGDFLSTSGGLVGVLDLLIQLHVDIGQPDSDRCTVILEEAKRQVQQSGSWPDGSSGSRLVNLDTGATVDVEPVEHRELDPEVLQALDASSPIHVPELLGPVGPEEGVRKAALERLAGVNE